MSLFRSAIVIVLIAISGLIVGTLYIEPQATDRSQSQAATLFDAAETETQIQKFCGACHQVPLPEHLPGPSWPDEINKAYRRYESSGRKDDVVPDQQRITDYFSLMAPKRMVIPDAPKSSESPVVFQPEIIELAKTDRTAAVSYLSIDRARPGASESKSRLLACNMDGGGVDRLSWTEGQWSSSRLSKLKHPDHLVGCDFDRDGIQDFLVADLGTLNATDELLGGVTLLRFTAETDSFEQIPVLEGLGRVADARPADLDGDGDDDVIVAEFGFETVGRLLWLETLHITKGRPETRLHVIDSRHGSIHAPPTDLDGDGDLDLIVLISQEHESIVAYFNNGHGIFTAKTLFQASSPSFGSSGLDLADLDADGDLDILFTNGDTLDKFQLKPFHGVHWLENRGLNQFEYHQLTVLPGAVKAIACDLDSDGDLDIAAVAFCPSVLRHQDRPRIFDTLIWLEQKSSGQFERHSLERSGDGHVSFAAGDFDDDGQLDLAVGEASFDPDVRRWLTIYWNRGTRTQASEDARQ